MNPLLERLLGNMDCIDAAYLAELEETEAMVRKKYEVFVSELLDDIYGGKLAVDAGFLEPLVYVRSKLG